MKIKNIFALILVVCMIAMLFAACDKKDPDTTDPSSSAPVVSDTPDDGDGDDEEMATVYFWMADIGNAGVAGTKAREVEAAINAYTEENLNIHIEFTWQRTSDIGTQAGLAIANKEDIDIVVTTPVGPGHFNTYYSTGMAMDISPYLEEYGQGIIEIMEPMGLLRAYTMPDGGLYGLPTYRLLNTNFYAVYRTDVLESVGMVDTFTNMKTWADYETVLQAIKDQGEMYPTGGAKTLTVTGFVFSPDIALADSYAFDTLGDATTTIFSDDKGNVSNAFENPALRAQYDMFADWAAKGFVYSDTPYTNEFGDTLIGAGSFAGSLMASEFGIEVNKAQSVGTPVTVVQIAPGLLSTASCNKFGVVVTSACQDPEAAVKLLNAFYTTPELMNLINWGIEGETYEVTDGVAGYIGEADASTSGYHGMDFVFGNQFLTMPWTGAQGGSDFRNLAYENFTSAGTSVYMGLTVDVTVVDSVRAAISAVRDEYTPQVFSGFFTDEIYDEFIEKLYVAGLEEYVDLFQTSVDEFLSK